MSDCPFCDLPQDRVVAGTEAMVVVRDHHPVTKGHTLIIPRRHVDSIFELDEKEWAQLHSLLRQTKAALDGEHQPAGYNVGTNVGQAAGQSQTHAYLHVIPRYPGDHPAPEGGVRHVLPWTR